MKAFGTGVPLGQCGFANGGIVRQGTFLQLRIGNKLLRESVGLYRNNIDKTLSVLGGNAEVLEKGEHVLPDGFVMFIDQAPVFGFAPHFRLADTGENGTEDFFAQNDQCADHTDGFQVEPSIGETWLVWLTGFWRGVFSGRKRPGVRRI